MMPRTYTKGKRAEQEAETRQRIIEAALALHGEVGPASTTISMIAERAGVQRHTVYAHLPDNRSVFMACSGLHAQRAPLPSPELWSDLKDPDSRLRAAIGALYAWFAGNEKLLAHVLRDAEEDDTLREVSEFRFGAPLAAIHASLAASLVESQLPALAVATSFYTWRTLTHEAGQPADAAVELATRIVLSAA